MLLPTVTWGTLRAIAKEAKEKNVLMAENLLADPEMLKQSEGKADDEYVFPEDAAQFLEDFGDLEETPVTAAGTPEQPEEELEDDPMLSPLYFTVDDSGLVLELVKADDEGLFIRIEGEWVDISDEEEFPTVYEQTIMFANDKSVGIWDAEFEDKDDLKKEDIKDYIIK